MVSVKCVICGRKFQTYPSVAGKRRACSRQCGIRLASQTRTSSRVRVKCRVCGKTEIVPPSIARTRVTCSRECQAKWHRNIVLKSLTIEQKKRSKMIPKFCQYCGERFFRGRGRFCSCSCFKQSHQITKKCEVCGTEMVLRVSARDRRFCSVLCRSQAQSLGMIKGHSSGNYGYRKDLKTTFRSSYEANFARLCNHFGWKWEYEPKSFKTSLGFYTPDFFVKHFGGYVELRGGKYRSLKKAMLASHTYGFRLAVIYWNDFVSKYGHLSSKIKGWEDSRRVILEDIDPSVWDKRVCMCGKEFYHRISSTQKGEYCSVGCANKYKWEKPHSYHRLETRKIVCRQCRKIFLSKRNAKFCSHRCYSENLRNVNRD